MITSIYFDNFKAHEKFSISLRDFNILIGQNNAGKSTILDAFRILEGAYRFASRYNPKNVVLASGQLKTGYEIPQTSIPIIVENLQTNYNDFAATIRYRFSEGQNLLIEFSKDRQPILYLDTPRKTPNSSTTFRKEFNLNLAIIPTLGPLEIDEEILDDKYVKRWSGSRRAPRMFRNIWYHDTEGFQLFKDIVEKTWPKMSIKLPEKKDTFSKELIMYCEEDRILREVSWAGFGFQIWLQLLTHIVKFRNANIIVVDEPEIYLHPDLQHKILAILKDLPARIILATHSVEIINNAEPSDVLLIDREYQSAQRMSDLAGLQRAADIIGSGQNIQLARLARGKKVLFVEGKDLNYLSRLSKICGFDSLFTTGDLTVIPVHGFTQHDKIIHANWAFSTVLGEQLQLAAIFDRDYRCDEEIVDFKKKLGAELDLIHVLERKEIENYLLDITCIQLAVEEKLSARVKHGNLSDIPLFSAGKILEGIFEEIKSDTFGQLGASEYRFYQKSGQELAKIIASQQKRFDITWIDSNERVKLVPGKIVLAKLNEILQTDYGVSISMNSIISKMRPDQVGKDLVEFFQTLESFRINKL